MKTRDAYLDEALFSRFLQVLPQTSVELVVEHENRVLVAKRRNEPAKGEWFVPGSRLYKGERFTEAVDRIAREELGIEVTPVRQLGAFNHFWSSGAFPEVSKTHTVNVVYHVRPEDPTQIQLDDQHEAFVFTDGSDFHLHPQIVEYLDLIGIDAEGATPQQEGSER